MEEDAKDNGSPTAPESTDIQNYLSSFNKEIEDGGANQNVACDDLNKQDECYGIGIVPNDQAKVQYVAENEGILTGTAYFAAPDGTLYSTAATAAATGQGELGPQIAFLAPGGGTFANGSGVQQILLAVGDGTGLTTLDGKTLSFTVPVQISSQLPGFKSSNLELPKSAELPKSEENEPKGAQSKESVCEEPENDPEQESEGKEDSQQGENQAKPQPVVVVQQQPGQETVGQMLPIGTAGQAIISSLGNALQMSDQQAVQMVASIAEQAEGSGNIVASNSAAAVAPYQTIAIVPSETNSGELSYVLFMSPTKESSEKAGSENIKDEADDNDENIDLSIYDFQDGDNNSKEYMAVQAEDGSIRTIRLNHRKSQVVTQQHMCNYCNYTSPKRYLLSRHMKSHSDERPHKCSVCERGFKTLASLQNHVNTHTGTRPHACKDCNSCFTTSGELVRHIRYKHTHEKPHHCTECDYASVELSKLKRHMRCHTGERPYQCPHCTYASPDTYKLKRHLRIHTGEKPYKCDVCSARFTQSNSLKAHKLIHSGNKPIFHCQFCPATCGRKTDLRIHIQKLHSSDQLHRCKRCGKVFQDKYNFKLHTKSHEGEKCFKCDLCPYASITMRHLETHMLIHTDQKPFQCDQCDQSFRQKQLLRRHKNLYHNPDYVPPEPKEKNLVCSECNRAFRHKGNLIRHFAIHDPDATAAEREEAMRIGQPKEPGEVRDGEEDDYDEDTSDYNEIECGTDGNKQVVVFEVIQLSGNGPAGQVQGINTTTGESVKLEGENQAFAIIQQVTSEEKNEEEEMTFCELSNAECLPPSAVKLEVKDEACGESIIGSCSGIFPKESSLEEFESACVTEAKVTSSCDETSHNIAQIITDNEQCSADGNAPAEENTRTSDGNDVESSAEQLCQEQEERGTASGFMVSQNDDDDDGEATLKIPDTE